LPPKCIKYFDVQYLHNLQGVLIHNWRVKTNGYVTNIKNWRCITRNSREGISECIRTCTVISYNLNCIQRCVMYMYQVPRLVPLPSQKTIFVCPQTCVTLVYWLVRDSSAVRRLFVQLAGAVGCPSALHKENSGFATPTLGWHISTFRGYRILFYIRNPYINHFTNHFSIHYTPHKQSWGVYRNHPVRPSIYLVSATPPQRLIGFLWNYTHL
jgi:hypothetical protein